MLGTASKQHLRKLLRQSESFQSVGKLCSAEGVLTAQIQAEVGEICAIETAISGSNGTRNHSLLTHDVGQDPQVVLGEAIGFQGNQTRIMPYTKCQNVRPGVTVRSLGRRLQAPVGTNLLGRVINGLGQPIDGKGPIGHRKTKSLPDSSPSSMSRRRITEKLVTGIRVIDGLLTVGQGQRVALLAGSGVGKSTLLGDVARGSSADVNVVALIGERGREVRPFLDDCLGEEGLRKSVVIVATADEEPLMRVRSAGVAMAIADQFRSTGKKVLFMMDSITRIATSQREIGLMLGEPPTLKGYTPSVFRLMTDLLEQMGNSDVGSITGIVSVLVEGDDMDEPICDAVRSVVDGHIVLDRGLAEHGHFPAVSIPQSVSRVFRDITDAHHQDSTWKLRDALATYSEVEDLIRVGAYQTGTSHQIDKAIHLKSAIDKFVRQSVNSPCRFAETRNQLLTLASRWGEQI